MQDPRIEKLAKNIVRYACDVQPGENVLIENTGFERDFVTALVREIYAAGGNPFVDIKDPAVNRALMMNCSEPQLELMAKVESLRMENMQAYIGIRAGDNMMETGDVPGDKQQLSARLYSHPVHSLIRVPHTK